MFYNYYENLRGNLRSSMGVVFHLFVISANPKNVSSSGGNFRGLHQSLNKEVKHND